MKLRMGLLLFLLVLPAMAWSQSTLNFPRQFAVTELSGTGFAVVNPGATSASVTFTMYSATGATVATSTQTIAAKGQLSKLGTDLFPAAAAGGWVQASSNATGLQGFWLGGDFATYTDGGDAAVSAADMVFPLVAGQTEINITNTGATANTVTIRLRGANGTDVASSAAATIPARGIYQVQASAIFPGADFSQATYIKVSGTSAFAGTSVIRGFLVPTESAVLNAVDSSSTVNTLNFAHAASGPLGGSNYTTTLGLTNLVASTQSVTLTFYPDSGGAPIAVQQSLPPSGAIRDSAQNIFGLPGGFQSGWIKAAAPSPITGFVAYAETSSGGLAAVPVQAAPQSSMLFGHIAGLPTWYTGLALLNASTTNANVEVFALTPTGGLIGGPPTIATAAFTLAAGGKATKLLSQLIPATVSQNGGFVFVRTTNGVPLYGIELFGSNSGTILSNVAAGGLAAGITFTPPTPVILTSILPARAARGATITLTGSGFDLLPANNSIVFTTSSGTVEITSSIATATSLTATVPSTAITGPVLVKSGAQSSSSIVLEVTASATTQIQSSVTVASGQTAAADIYVPPNAGAVLNITAMGVANVTDTSVSFDTKSVDLPRGQTKLLVVGGTGLSQANGSSLSISGSGITVSNVLFNSTFITAQVTVDSGAAVGPRNVIVINSNLDTTVFSGGVYIR